MTHEFFGRRRARLDDRDNEVARLGAAEQAAFVDTVLPVLARYRARLDPTLFESLSTRLLERWPLIPARPPMADSAG